MNRGIIILGGAFVLIIGGWILLFQLPVQTKMTNHKIRLNEYTQKEHQQVSEARVAMMEQKVDSLNARFKKEKNRVFLEERLASLGTEIDRLVRKYNLTLFDVTPGYHNLRGFTENLEEIAELPLRIELKGSFRRFSSFFDDLPQFPFVMRIDDVVLEKIDPSRAELKIRMQGVILIRKERDNENIKEVKIAKNQA